MERNYRTISGILGFNPIRFRKQKIDLEYYYQQTYFGIRSYIVWLDGGICWAKDGVLAQTI